MPPACLARFLFLQNSDFLNFTANDMIPHNSLFPHIIIFHIKGWFSARGWNNSNTNGFYRSRGVFFVILDIFAKFHVFLVDFMRFYANYMSFSFWIPFVFIWIIFILCEIYAFLRETSAFFVKILEASSKLQLQQS